MATLSRAVRLGQADLGKERHICALFEGAEDAASVMVPFVVEALDRGDRVIHLVGSRRAYLRRLSSEIDVTAVVESGQLDVRSWQTSYLSNGLFSGSRMLTYVRRTLREGQSIGFPATRLIGDMEWARDRLPGVGELVQYESGLDAILARPQTTVVCAYDLHRHSGHRIAGILAAHRVAFVRGKLQRAPRAVGASTRERIMAAASLLFAENGIARTGVDALIDASGVAKATFYRHFPSKDALIVAWLQAPATRWFDRVRAQAEARAANASEVVPRFFEAVAEWLEADDFVGCPYLNTSVEIPDVGHPAADVIREALEEIGSYLQGAVARTGHPDSVRLGQELHALVAGAIALGAANRSTAPTFAARDAASRLLATTL